jgi:hypothetical protein
VIPKTRLMILSIPFTLALLAGALAGEDKAFRASSADSYAHQSADQVTVGAKPFDREELTAEAFGKKTDHLKYGVLPVLVVIENKRPKALDLRDLEVSLVASDGRHVSAISPEDVQFAKPQKRSGGASVPLPVPLPKKKNPLTGPEIVMRAFSAKIIPPGDSASGFFYFEAKSETGDKLYLNGLRDVRSGDEVMYFEFPFNPESSKEP